MSTTTSGRRLEVIGGGKMGEALTAGLIASGWATEYQLRVVERLPERAAELARRFPGMEVTDAPTGDAEGHVIAVKPGDVPTVCAMLPTDVPDAPAGTRQRPVLSIAAGVTIGQLEQALPKGTPVVRAMPNTPALVGAGAAAIAPGNEAGEADLAWAEEILGAVGTVVRVTESLLDAVTGLSGSGPAYIFLVVEALIEAGVLVGLPRQASVDLVIQTVAGAGKLLAESDAGAEALRAAVTSPGGTTAAGLRALEQAGVRAAFLEAVVAATERSRQLGQ